MWCVKSKFLEPIKDLNELIAAIRGVSLIIIIRLKFFSDLYFYLMQVERVLTAAATRHGKVAYDVENALFTVAVKTNTFIHRL